MIRDCDGLTDPSKVNFDRLYVWAKIHIILELYRRDLVVDELAKRIGRVWEVQMFPNLVYEGDYGCCSSNKGADSFCSVERPPPNFSIGLHLGGRQ